MSKAKSELIKVTVDSRNQVHDLIDALIGNYDVYIKKVKVRDNKYCIEISRFEVLIYEREQDE